MLIVIIILAVILVLSIRETFQKDREISELKDKLYSANEQLAYGEVIDGQRWRGIEALAALGRMAHKRMMQYHDDKTVDDFIAISEAASVAHEWVLNGEGKGDRSDSDYPFEDKA